MFIYISSDGVVFSHHVSTHSLAIFMLHTEDPVSTCRKILRWRQCLEVSYLSFVRIFRMNDLIQHLTFIFMVALIL